jgi:hypothetical protein
MLIEIKKTLAILKERWPEALLIIALAAMIWLIPELFVQKPSQDISAQPVFPYILAGLLRFGFLRTVFTTGTAPHLPTQLIKVGAHFFRRMIGFALLFAIGLFLITTVFIHLLQAAFAPETAIENLPAWLRNLAVQLTFILLIKVVILIEPIIIVKDCPLFTAFRAFRYYRLLDAKVLIVIYLIQIIISFLTQWLLATEIPSGPGQKTWFAAATAVINFLDLLVAVTALRFVASVDFGYDTNIPSKTGPTDTEQNENDSAQY